MERFPRPIWLVALSVLLCASQVPAQYAVEIGIKETDGRWKDTLLAGEAHVLTVSITNPVPVASYTLPFRIQSEAFGAFATGGAETDVLYVGRMSDPTKPFTIRTVNVNGIDGISPDSLLFGAVEFGSNTLPAGTGIVIEFPFTAQPYVGSVRIDTALLPPSNRLSFALPDATEITDVAFNSNPVFPVVLRVPNAGPSCSGPSDLEVPFGTPITATFTGSDPEGNALTFKQISGPGSTSPAGSFSWTPGCADVGVHPVCVTISDPSHLDWDTCCFAITVTQTVPTLACTDQVVHYADTLSYFLPGADDGCPLALRYFKTSGPGAVNFSTGEYRYVPGCGAVGSATVSVGVTDGQDTATCSFEVTVTNQPPEIACPANFSLGIGDTLDYQVPGFDPDGDELVYTLLDFVKLSGPTPNPPNVPPSLSTDGLLFWPTSTANDDDFGVWQISLRADEPCDSAFCSFEIEVTPNRPPVCSSPGRQSVHWSEGSASVALSFFDPDGDPFTFSQVSGPGSLDTSGIWTWTFSCEDVGEYPICVVVSDSAFPAGDTCCFTFEVFQSPPLVPCRDTSIHAGTGPLQMSLATSDDGCPGGPIRYYKIYGPGELDSATGVYSWVPATSRFTCDDIGSYRVAVYATDGQRGDTCGFSVSVVNTAPIFYNCPAPDEIISHTVDRPFVFESNPEDPDGDDILSIRIRNFNRLEGSPGGPNEAPTVDSTGRVTWNTDSSNTFDLGVWRIVLEAEDTCASRRCSVTVEVFPNRPLSCYVGDKSAHVSDTSYNGILGVDPDGDSLTFDLISGPGSFYETGNIARWSWVPECEDLGVHEVCFEVSDEVFADADTCCFDVTVFEEAPVLFCSTQTVHYGDSVSYDIAIEDDACPQAAAFALLEGPGTIDPVTGRYELETSCIDVGTIPVTVELFDGNRADTCTFDVVVTNTSPFVDCPEDQLGLKVGVTVDLTIPFGDADSDPTSISLVSFQKLGGVNPNPPNNPPSLDAGGNFQWITDFNNLNDVATWEVTVRVDEPCDSAICKFRIEILPNEPPTCSSPADFEGVCDELNDALFSASDPENDPVTFALVSGPGVVNSSSGVWSWTPPCDSGGVHEICVSVSDFLHTEADTCCVTVAICAVAAPGDVDGDGVGNVTDIILLVNFMFKSAALPFGDYTADMNCDGLPNSEDIILLVNYAFKSGSPPCDACTSPLFLGVGP